MTIDYLNMTAGELQAFLNSAKEVLFNRLEREGHIKNSEELSASYAIVVVQPGWLGRIISKLRGHKDGQLTFEIVKIV